MKPKFNTDAIDAFWKASEEARVAGRLRRAHEEQTLTAFFAWLRLGEKGEQEATDK